MIKLERESNPIDYPTYPYTFVDDSADLAAKIDEVDGLVTSFDGSDTSVHKKFFSKLVYLLGRINRCKATNANEKVTQSKLMVKILNLKSNLERKIK